TAHESATGAVAAVRQRITRERWYRAEREIDIGGTGVAPSRALGVGGNHVDDARAEGTVRDRQRSAVQAACGAAVAVAPRVGGGGGGEKEAFATAAGDVRD